jgi:hypothetical protein
MSFSIASSRSGDVFSHGPLFLFALAFISKARRLLPIPVSWLKVSLSVPAGVLRDIDVKSHPLSY